MKPPATAGVCVACAAALCAVLVARAQPATTAPSVKLPGPITAPVNPGVMSTVASTVLSLSYPAPGQNAPSTTVSFPVVDYSFAVPGTTGATSAAGRASGATATYLSVTADASHGPPLRLGAPAALTSLTLTVSKPGKATLQMSFARPYLTSTSYSTASGVMQQRLQFNYTQVTTSTP